MTPFGLRLPLLALALAFSIALVFAPGRASAADGASSYRDKKQCVSYVAERWLREFGDPLLFWEGDSGRHARTFIPRCKKTEGCRVADAPKIGAIAYEPRSRWGHVSFVEEVFADGSFRVRESNFVGGRVTSRVLASGAVREFIEPRIRVATAVLPEAMMIADAAIGPAAPPSEETPQGPLEDRKSDCVVPASAIAAGKEPEHFTPRHGRFSKVPEQLVSIYESACEVHDVPVRYLLAQGSYETHFTAKLGDGRRSCGVHQFYRGRKPDWKGWGFETVEDCLDPSQNIPRAAQHLRELMDGKVFPKLGKRTMAQALYHYNGSGAAATRYSQTILKGGDTYYRS